MDEDSQTTPEIRECRAGKGIWFEGESLLSNHEKAQCRNQDMEIMDVDVEATNLESWANGSSEERSETLQSKDKSDEATRTESAHPWPVAGDIGDEDDNDD